MNPSMRLKVNGDTFFLPDSDDGVYFRNNRGSFRMEGTAIDKWIEKLIPVFTGEHTMEELTDRLPAPHRNRVYEIAESLYQNGFVRDVSQDRPHHLPDEIVRKYASQIEFLDSFGGSGAHRFQSYRQSNVLAVGSGPFFVSLIAALLESGLPKLRMLITDALPTSRQRLEELVAHARATDREVEAEEIAVRKEGGIPWREVVRPFEAILYVSQEGDLSELRALHAACRAENKVLLPAICARQVGLAGPLVHPGSEGCWESAFRRLHQTALDKDPQLHAFSSTAGAMLANVIVFEWLKWMTEATAPEQTDRLFLLNLETLEGSWHSFLPHPLVNRRPEAERMQPVDWECERISGRNESGGLLPYFSRLTSAETGIFHRLEEGDLQQLPLSQCRVQAADPLSVGPAELLPEIVCAGLTHEEARREAGLAGIEAYVSRMVPPRQRMGVGAGVTVAESVCRALQMWLTAEWSEQMADREPVVTRIQLGAVEDERCRFYLQALTTMQGEPVIGLGDHVSGFPVLWVGTSGSWYGSAGLNTTMALRKALQLALQKAQNGTLCRLVQASERSSVLLQERGSLHVEIPAWEEAAHSDLLKSALQVLERNRKRLLVFDLATEPFLKEELAGAFGVSLREEEAW